MTDKALEVRCYCADRPLLAMCGSDPKTGEPWVHVKTWKGGKLYAEVIATAGIVKLRCRKCLRWHRLQIIKGAPRLEKVSAPPTELL